MARKDERSETGSAADVRRTTVREVRQRLEGLRRAGVDRIPRSAATADAREPAGLAPATAPSERSRVIPIAEPAPARPAPAPVPPPPTSAPTEVSSSASLFDDSLVTEPALSLDERIERLEALRAKVATCQHCPVLASSRTQTVFGEGNPAARLMFIGEAPGADEDRTGRPFVGRAGQLLTDMITKGMGLAREDVYIANILKSRPPDNRPPLADEMAKCLPFLEEQIQIIRPEFLCLLGRTAVTGILQADPTVSMGRLRQRWHRYRGIPTLVTYHPAYLLRNPASKKDTWDDLQMLMSAMGLELPKRKSE